MVSLRLLSLISLVSVVLASPKYRDFVLHERRDTVPRGFVHNGPASVNQTITLKIALNSNNLAGLEKALLDVSTPSSALYGQHLTKEEVEAFVAPTSETTNAVNEFLSSHGITPTTISPAGDWLSFTVDIAKANQMFAADFSVFTYESTGEQTIRTLSYSVPAALQPHVELVHPTVAYARFPIVLPDVTATSDAVPASCATEITPTCLQALYGIPHSVPSQSGSNISVSGFINQFPQVADLKSFLIDFRPDIPPNTTFSVQSVDGGSQNLDIQYTVGVAGGVPVTYISVGSENTDGIDGFLDIINILIAQTSPPLVLTTSFGFDEPDVPAAIATKLCNAYMQLGARGTTILFSSGDGGVSGVHSKACTTFIPTFPSGCPFVTSVGATTGISPETAATFSSGGFSTLFARPSYQAAAVAAYLKFLGSTNAGKYNASGRGFPDIAAQGENVVIVNAGTQVLVAGTSCSAPILASTFSLLNAQLLAAGKPVIGFLNPFIYTNIGIFTPISTGSNPGCNTNGFPATVGWDPITGVGTPVFANLRTAFGLS
ncbi:hypothetical protein M422DRAFT_191590 [Sphaerobolus stellatus SS14]|uniref:Peptidase S53 domain-containing protein n=1 Tax=Sphaerobolus stellatus (strain SS14) TaxID=990650 RepID=A0A0C9TYM2_SPHS4|nr:hypothetical protein M422DRAFT_191590 [Sphaerobolus stellatus SS14]